MNGANTVRSGRLSNYNISININLRHCDRCNKFRFTEACADMVEFEDEDESSEMVPFIVYLCSACIKKDAEEYEETVVGQAEKIVGGEYE